MHGAIFTFRTSEKSVLEEWTKASERHSDYALGHRDLTSPCELVRCASGIEVLAHGTGNVCSSCDQDAACKLSRSGGSALA
mmetsp:Transcript_55856/g.155739  ORF Transcript_55856/g.155739 Transcript_55856/m.155739 type:complete len:81 (-) Transcript_55856:4-246(-)